MVDAVQNLVWETTESTASPYSLTTVAQSFNSAYGTGGTDKFFFGMYNQGAAGEWMVASGHLSAASTLVLDTVIEGSNGASEVLWSAGKKNIVCGIPADYQVRFSRSDTAPTAPGEGDFWVRTTDMALFVYYNDGNSSQWVEVGGSGASGPIFVDGNGNEVLDVEGGTASAVNYIDIDNAATGVEPTIKAAGGDTNIDLGLDGKGTGGVVAGAIAGAGQGTLNAQNGLFDGSNRVSWNLIASGTFSAATELDFDFEGNSEYTDFMVVLRNTRLSSGVGEVHLRTSANSGSTFDSAANDYEWGVFYTASSSTTVSVDKSGGTGANHAETGCYIGTGTSYAGQIELTFFDPQTSDTDYKMYYGQSVSSYYSSAGDRYGSIFWGLRWDLGVVDQLRLYPSVNSFSGDYSFYGRRS